MDTFYVMNNSDGTYRIECKCIIYRALHGKHPDWAKPTGNERDGFNTKYFLLIDDYIKSEEEAKQAAEYLNNEYKELITRCEDTGNWEEFPFKENEIIYWK